MFGFKVFELRHLSHRMLLAFGLILLILLFLTAIALQRVGTMGNALEAVSGKGTQRSQVVRGIERSAASYGTVLRMMAASLTNANEKGHAQLTADYQSFVSNVGRARALITDPQGLALVKEAEAHGLAIQEIAAQATKETSDRGPAAIAFSIRLLFMQDIAKWGKELDAWSESAQKLTAWDEEQSRLDAQSSAGLAQSTRIILVSGALVAFLLAAGLGWWVTHNVTQAVGQASLAARCMANHDLSQPIRTSRRDEIGQLLLALEELRQRQADLASEVIEGSSSIMQAANEIAQGSAQLGERTETTATMLQRASDAMQTLVGSVEQTTDSAKKANLLANSARTDAAEGQQVVSGAVAIMSSVDDASRRIADIITMIDGVSFQTNILALNAAVEAARAGAQGRGFAVVAAEVRQLAGRSAVAAKEIRALIQDSQTKVAQGSQQVVLAGNSTQKILESIERVSQVMDVIHHDAATQLETITETRGAVHGLESVAQQNAALAEQATAAAYSLTERATRLATLVETFKLEPGHGISSRPNQAMPRLTI